MSTELKIMDPSVLSESERTELEANIDSLIAAHKNNRQEINRLVFESVAAMTAGEDYERQLANKKGLRRFLGGITGSNKELQDKINSSRAAAQYASQQTLQRLAEQNLMTFDLITAVNNKLNASVVAVESEINQIYGTLTAFFMRNRSDMLQLENRVAKLERNVNLLNWQASIEYHMLGETEYTDLDDTAKIVCLVRDFYDISRGEWSTSDLLVLKAAMDEIGISPKRKLNYDSFIRNLHGREELYAKLLGGQAIAGLPQPDYLPVLCGLKKLELLETEESYIVKTAAGLLSSHQMDVGAEQISNDLTANFLAQEGSFNINTEVDCYSLILELLFSLRQAQAEGILSDGMEDVADVEALVVDSPASKENELTPDEWYRLGRSYAEGDGGEPNPAEAVRCYQIAAEQGHVTSQLALAECYETGTGVDKDQTLATAWYTKASEQGHSEATYQLAKYYARQRVRTEDADKKQLLAKKSKECYKKAAEQGHPEAQYQMGWDECSFYYMGFMDTLFSAIRRSETSQKNAYHWYKKAAEQGHIEAQYCLGRCYEGGIGVERSISQAKEWYRKAASSGHKDAKERLKQLL